MDFLKWYKHKIISSDLEPSENVWERIQEHLSIERSWNAIEKNLSKKTAHKRIKYTSISASLLLFILLGGSWFVQNDNKPFDMPTATHDLKQIEKSNIQVKSNTKLATIKKTDLNEINNNTKQDQPYLNEDINIVNNEIAIEDKIINRIERKLSKLKHQQISYGDSILHNLIIAQSYNQNEY